MVSGQRSTSPGHSTQPNWGLTVTASRIILQNLALPLKQTVGESLTSRDRENDYLADYRLAHAASSSGVFQSLASAVSLKSRPLNDSSSFLCRKKRAKS